MAQVDAEMGNVPDEVQENLEDSAIKASIEYFASFQDINVKCYHCMERFDHATHLPITLHCGHSVCEPCLNEVKRRRECPQCDYTNAEIVTVRPSPDKTYPYNILLLEVLKYESASLANQQIKFENLCSSVCNRFLKKYNDIVNHLNLWFEHIQIGEGYLITLQFYEQELAIANDIINPDPIDNPDEKDSDLVDPDQADIIKANEIAARMVAAIERLQKRDNSDEKDSYEKDSDKKDSDEKDSDENYSDEKDSDEKDSDLVYPDREDIIKARKITAVMLAEIERLAKRFTYEWTQIINCHKAQIVKGYKLFLFPFHVPTFMTILANNPKLCYAVKDVKGKDKFYQISGGEIRFHLHRESPPPPKESRPFYFQFDDVMDIVGYTKIDAFFTMKRKSKTETRFHRIYMELRYNFYFGASTLSLFLGDFDGLSYADFSVEVLPGRIFISCNTPYSQSLEVPDEIEENGLLTTDCTAGQVVAEWKGEVGSMNILLDDSLYYFDPENLRVKSKTPPNIYYGEVFSGLNFLRDLSIDDEVTIVDCGVSGLAL